MKPSKSNDAPETRRADFEVWLQLLPSADGGRQTSVASGYRPNHQIAALCAPLCTFMGAVELDEPLAPGARALASVRALVSPAQLAAVRVAGGWAVYEGPRHVGDAHIVRELPVPPGSPTDRLP